jgi:hypothetical protein
MEELEVGAEGAWNKGEVSFGNERAYASLLNREGQGLGKALDLVNKHEKLSSAIGGKLGAAV